MHVLLIVMVIDVFIKYTAAEYGYVTMMDKFRSFMSQKKFPPPLQESILTKFEYSYQRRYFREEIILSTVSGKNRLY